jgi:hypothetical protein
MFSLWLNLALKNRQQLCVDYRKLNDITIKNRFPMPVIDEILVELAGSKIFTKLDMRLGYHHIRMLLDDEHKTAFKTHHGHYQTKSCLSV